MSHCGVIVCVWYNLAILHAQVRVKSKTMNKHWYLLLLFQACSIKEQEQRLVGFRIMFQGGVTCILAACFSKLAVLKTKQTGLV